MNAMWAYQRAARWAGILPTGTNLVLAHSPGEWAVHYWEVSDPGRAHHAVRGLDLCGVTSKREAHLVITSATRALEAANALRKAELLDLANPTAHRGS